MEKLLVDGIMHNGTNTIAALCVLFAINVAVNVCKFLLSMREKKDKITDEMLQRSSRGLRSIRTRPIGTPSLSPSSKKRFPICRNSSWISGARSPHSE